MYAAYGVASPFLPAFVSERGLPPERLGAQGFWLMAALCLLALASTYKLR
jgi:hypothetical protein